ncbi:MAG: tripartite tricarboxylate transporter substrate binding protein [Betaproteobacteria bacterium]|jgi:tripartite-type tricarboxylate transporter receptor subunit TctC|nr:tripartite tricarboxylate transporter substrate binding protein [Betaproteobacteria bacterium]
MNARRLTLIPSLCLAALSLAGAGTLVEARAAYPEKPIKIIVPFPAGGASDAAARAIGQSFAKGLGQPVVVENRPGASGGIAAQSVMTAPPDGYTILWGSASMVALPLILKKPPFAAMGELSAIGTVGRLPFALFVNPEVPARTMAELSAHLRANPGKLNYATGSLSEFMAGAQFVKTAGAEVERVAYKGGAQVMPDLVAGRVQMNFGPASTGMTYVNGGRLRVIATLLPARSALMPDVPTAAESGFPDLVVPTWQALLAPPKTPPGVVDRLSRALEAALGDPEVLAMFKRIGVQPASSSPAALVTLMRDDASLWARFVKDYGIEPD